jgi:hypothetical protein
MSDELRYEVFPILNFCQASALYYLKTGDDFLKIYHPTMSFLCKHELAESDEDWEWGDEGWAYVITRKGRLALLIWMRQNRRKDEVSIWDIFKRLKKEGVKL